MEYHLTKQTVCQPVFALNTASEQPVDFDITLPDYCPDIERILCCRLIPKIYAESLSSDRINIEGGSCARIMYIDGDRGCVRSYEYAQPFSASFPLAERSSDCALYVDAKPEYINCRALSPRKLSLHGAFSLCVRAVTSEELNYYTDADEDDLQLKKEMLKASDLTGLCSESFTVQEEIPAGAKDGISTLLEHRLTAEITELKAIHNKIMLNADLKLELMYLSDTGDCRVECMSYSLPVSRVVDCDGADENSVIDGSLDVMSEELKLGGDALDGSALLSLEAKLSFAALCSCEKEIEIICDAFSVGREAELRCVPFCCRGDTVCLTSDDMGKSDISVDDPISRILDLHCEKLTVTPFVSDGMVRLTAKLCVSMMYENTDGEIRCIERDAEFSFDPDTGGRDCVESLRPSLGSLSYRMIDGHKVELRAEIRCRMALCRRVSCSAVTQISAPDDAPERAPEGSLILYYTDGGENVWDISKRFCSRPEDIIAENDLGGDTVDGGVMLLIPTA